MGHFHFCYFLPLFAGLNRLKPVSDKKYFLPAKMPTLGWTNTFKPRFIEKWWGKTGGEKVKFWKYIACVTIFMFIDRCRHKQQLLKMPWVMGVIAGMPWVIFWEKLREIVKHLLNGIRRHLDVVATPSRCHAKFTILQRHWIILKSHGVGMSSGMITGNTSCLFLYM